MAEKLYAFFVLYVLRQHGELSGYRIAKIITEITEGYFSPTPGNIYPVLGSLEQSGFVKAKKSKAAGTEPGGRRRKILIEITPAGEAALFDFAKRNREWSEKLTFFFDKVIEGAS
jgi:DNA-binding PadR family transcriptional regulator